MVKLIGKNKINTSVFISGRGSNLKNLFKFSKHKQSPIKISLVLSSSKMAKGLKFAKSNNIKYLSINYNQKNIEKKILLILKKNNIHMICLAGFMKILSKNFISKFKGKILNIHPSLLPKYKGLNTHERVLKNKDKYIEKRKYWADQCSWKADGKSCHRISKMISQYVKTGERKQVI